MCCVALLWGAPAVKSHSFMGVTTSGHVTPAIQEYLFNYIWADYFQTPESWRSQALRWSICGLGWRIHPVRGATILGGDGSIGIRSCVKGKYTRLVVAMLELLVWSELGPPVFFKALRTGRAREGRHKGVMRPWLWGTHRPVIHGPIPL